MTEKAIIEEVRKHNLRNEELRARFLEKKVDLEDPRPVEFHFWAWSQRDAAVLARGLYEMGFLIRLLAPATTDEDPDRWAVEAGAKIGLVRALGSELVEKLVRLAAKDDSVFDGWGASV